MVSFYIARVHMMSQAKLPFCVIVYETLAKDDTGEEFSECFIIDAPGDIRNEQFLVAELEIESTVIRMPVSKVNVELRHLGYVPISISHGSYKQIVDEKNGEFGLVATSSTTIWHLLAEAY